jgi:hypothetical protein
MTRRKKPPAAAFPPGAAEPAGRTNSKRPASTPGVHDDAALSRIDAIFALRAPGAAWQDARDEWLWRCAASAELVRRGQLSEPDRAERLKPWLAIACLCSVDLPELEERLAQLRCWRIDEAALGVTLPQARLMLADEICPDRKWRAELARAFTKANERLRGEHTEAESAHVQRIMRLIGATGGTLPPVPFPEIELTEQEAA